MSQTDEPRPPIPQFDLEGAVQKVRVAEDAWNSRDPAKVSLAYTVDGVWRTYKQPRHWAGFSFLANDWSWPIPA